MLERIRREPARVAGLIQAVMALAVAFGLDLSTEQQAVILGLSAAALGFAEGVRSRVTPVARKPKDDLDLTSDDIAAMFDAGEPLEARGPATWSGSSTTSIEWRPGQPEPQRPYWSPNSTPPKGRHAAE